MSQENVQIVREALSEFATSHQAVTRLLTPDSVWEMGTFRGWPDKPTYVGPAEFNEFFGKWIAPYAEWDIDLEDFRDVGDERVVAIVTQRGRLRGADSWVELQYAMVYSLTGGLISRVEVFAGRDEGLEAVGLSE